MGNRYNYLLIITLIMVLATVVSAAPIYKQNTNVTLSVPCKINGAVCGPTATCVGTIINPSDLVLYNNYSLIQNEAVFELNLTADDVSTVGEYRFSISCTQDGDSNSKDLTFIISPSGNDPQLFNIVFYIFLLIMCVVMVIGSGILILRNPMQEDKVALYNSMKRSRVDFYIKLLKQKLYIVGMFGAYIFTLLFLIILSRASFDLGIEEVNELIVNAIIILSWGLVPFVIFWIGFIIIYIYKQTEEILKYQFGGLTRP